jgi:hypothetical protein
MTGRPPGNPPPRGFEQRRAAADLVKNIIQQKVDDAKQAKVDADKALKKAKSRLPLLLALLPLLLGLTAWNVLSAGPPRSTLSTADQVASARFRIYIAAEAIEAYRGSHGTYPANLTQVGADWEGLHYVAADTTWSIVTRIDTTSITYRHGDPLAPYASAYQSLQRRKR